MSGPKGRNRSFSSSYSELARSLLYADNEQQLDGKSNRLVSDASTFMGYYASRLDMSQKCVQITMKGMVVLSVMLSAVPGLMFVVAVFSSHRNVLTNYDNDRFKNDSKHKKGRSFHNFSYYCTGNLHSHFDNCFRYVFFLVYMLLFTALFCVVVFMFHRRKRFHPLRSRSRRFSQILSAACALFVWWACIGLMYDPSWLGCELTHFFNNVMFFLLLLPYWFRAYRMKILFENAGKQFHRFHVAASGGTMPVAGTPLAFGQFNLFEEAAGGPLPTVAVTTTPLSSSWRNPQMNDTSSIHSLDESYYASATHKSSQVNALLSTSVPTKKTTALSKKRQLKDARYEVGRGSAVMAEYSDDSREISDFSLKSQQSDIGIRSPKETLDGEGDCYESPEPIGSVNGSDNDSLELSSTLSPPLKAIRKKKSSFKQRLQRKLRKTKIMKKASLAIPSRSRRGADVLSGDDSRDFDDSDYDEDDADNDTEESTRIKPMSTDFNDAFIDERELKEDRRKAERRRYDSDESDDSDDSESYFGKQSIGFRERKVKVFDTKQLLPSETRRRLFQYFLAAMVPVFLLSTLSAILKWRMLPTFVTNCDRKAHNAAMDFWIPMNFMQSIGLALMIPVSIRNVFSDFSVKKELITVAIFEFGFCFAVCMFPLGNSLHSKKTAPCVLYLMLTRAAGLFTISMTVPVYKTFWKAKLPEIPNQLVIASLTSVLEDANAVVFFHRFMSDYNCLYLLNFWMEITYFKEMCAEINDELNDIMILSQSNQIYRKYFGTDNATVHSGASLVQTGIGYSSREIQRIVGEYECQSLALFFDANQSAGVGFSHTGGSQRRKRRRQQPKGVSLIGGDYYGEESDDSDYEYGSGESVSVSAEEDMRRHHHVFDNVHRIIFDHINRKYYRLFLSSHYCKELLAALQGQEAIYEKLVSERIL